MKPKLLIPFLILAIGVFSALTITTLSMQNAGFENQQEQALREEISLLMTQLTHVISALEQLTQNETIEKLIDLQIEVSRMKGVVFKRQNSLLVNYASLDNPISSLEGFLRLALLECSSDDDAIRPYVTKAAQLKIFLSELHNHFERVYGSFVRGQIRSQDIHVNTLHELNELISTINARVAELIHSPQ